MIFITKKSLETTIAEKVAEILDDNEVKLSVSLDYVSHLTTGQYKTFNEAVDLRRELAKKEDKLLKDTVDLDAEMDKAFEEEK